MEGPQNKTNFLDLSAQANEIECLYAARQVKLPAECTLATWIANVRSVAEQRLTNPEAGHTAMEHFQAVQLYRVTDAILALREVEDGDKYLRKIVAKLDFFDSERSPAKDIFWELELWWMIRRKLPAARLMDPPDIMLDLNGGTLGIACKSVYSESSVEKALSTGVKQITGNCEAGVVAFNIDSLLPKDCVIKAVDRAGLDELLHPIIDGFISRHRQHIDRYLNEQRLSGVVVCIAGVGDIRGWNVPFNTVRSTTIYAAHSPTQIAGQLLRHLHGILAAT